MKQKLRNIPRVTLTISIVLLVLAFVIPYDSLEFIFGHGPHALFIVSYLIVPILGLIGTITSVYSGENIALISNILLIFNFPLLVPLESYIISIYHTFNLLP